MSQMKIALRVFIYMTLLTGVIYPLLVTFIAQGLMPQRATGSLFEKKGIVIGSTLIAQNITDDKYFWPRPSAISYNPMNPSGGSNLGPTSKQLKEAVEERKRRFGPNAPAELLYASASGLDPHISLEAAYFQIERIAKARKMDPNVIRDIIDTHMEGRQFGFLGPKYVTVLILNKVLDDHERG